MKVAVLGKQVQKSTQVVTTQSSKGQDWKFLPVKVHHYGDKHAGQSVIMTDIWTGAERCIQQFQRENSAEDTANRPCTTIRVIHCINQEWGWPNKMTFPFFIIIIIIITGVVSTGFEQTFEWQNLTLLTDLHWQNSRLLPLSRPDVEKIWEKNKNACQKWDLLLSLTTRLNLKTSSAHCCDWSARVY